MNPQLLEWLASVKSDPYAFALGAFPWGEPGTLLEDAELDPWQIGILCDIRDGLLDVNTAIRLAVASGHGIGKSALVAIIILWAFSTFPDTRGMITANTETQLRTKTWAELGRWYNMFIAKEHFTLSATSLTSKDPTRERTWRIDMIPWSEKNPEAFAGMHNKGKRILIIFDEGSAIADVIYEVTEGALTDANTEIIWCVFGNPTRNSGRFRELFPGGRFAANWKTRSIDSRTVRITNKADIDAKIRAYGEDSDYVRIRVTGEFPRQGLMEFFSAADIDEAMSREVTPDPYAPLALGVDVARFGKNNSVIFPRKGRDARSIPRQSYNGLSTVELAQKVFEAQQAYRPDGIMVDEGGVGGGVVDNLRNMQLFIFGVQFGGKDTVNHAAFGAPGEKYANMRSGMHGALRAWLRHGALPYDPVLRSSMLSIKYVINKKDEIQLLSKEEIMDESPDAILDDIDALALTFAVSLARNGYAGGEGPAKPVVEYEYNPFDPERMVA